MKHEVLSNDDCLTVEELALAVKVFGTLAKWKREAASNQKTRTSLDDSNSDQIEDSEEIMQS